MTVCVKARRLPWGRDAMIRFAQSILFAAVAVLGTACVDASLEEGQTSSALTEDEGCLCPANFDPVCGADGVTYSNVCAAACAKATVDHVGECTTVFCPEVYQPVCGDDGRTYGNTCIAGRDHHTIAHAGECGIEGDDCGGLAGLPCQDGFKCRYDVGTFDAPHPDALGACVAENYCDAAVNCAGFPNVSVPGTWACADNACAWEHTPGWFAVAGFRFTTSHPYANNSRIVKEIVLPEGATGLRLVTLGTFNVEDGYDRLEVWTVRGADDVRLAGVFTGTKGPSASDVFPGTRFYVRFVSDASVRRHGFDIAADYAR